MVVVTVVAPSNNHTVDFDQPIPKPSYIRLLSCSIYNRSNNLEKDGEVYKKKRKPLILLFGNYNLDNVNFF